MIVRGFKLMTEKLDVGREESFSETFPYLKDWFESITDYQTMDLTDIF